MRLMKADWMSKPVKVYGWAILKNGWEYFFLSDKGSTRSAVVMGFETEMGDVSMKEIQPYIRSMTFKADDLKEIAPASGYSWVD